MLGKPLGILAASALAVATGVVVLPEGVSHRQFVGGACLCGVGDMLALLMADRAFQPEMAAVAKVAVLIGSIIAGIIGTSPAMLRAAPASHPDMEG